MKPPSARLTSVTEKGHWDVSGLLTESRAGGQRRLHRNSQGHADARPRNRVDFAP